MATDSRPWLLGFNLDGFFYFCSAGGDATAARMKTKPRKKLVNPHVLSDRDKQTALMAIDMDISTGSGKLRPEDMLQRERPSTVQDAIKRSRVWMLENWFVSEVLKLKLAFYNYGARLVAVNGGKQSKLNDFLEQNPKVQRDIDRYIREVWGEWNGVRTVISFWREEDKTYPVLLSPEDAQYSEPFGQPRLKVRLPYTKDQAPKGTSQALLDRYYSGKEITLDPEKWDEHFEVLTNNRRGQGFGYPDIYSIFRTMGQAESMEVGEHMLALAGRRILHRHKMGFEVKGNNPPKLQQDYATWKKKRSDAIISYYNGRFGFMDVTENFDQDIEVFIGDGGPKNYDGRKWDTVIRRMMWWGGPLGFMMVANSMNPFLLNMLKTSANEERKIVGDHASFVINSAFALPVPVKLKFDNRCFVDARLAWDMVATLLKQGPLSCTTALTDSDFDPENEKQLKRKEADKPEDFSPIFNTGGQGAGAAPGGGKAGRPTQKEASGSKRSGQTSGGR